MSPIIALITDFGLQDGYVASMKGVILGICPECRPVDVTHLVPPQDVRTGAFILGTVYKDFPPGTLFLGVVDPGVGTARRAVALETRHHTFVGPDNGLFSFVLDREKDWNARSLENSRYWRARVSATFHGRDIFAPVAAHLAKGLDFSELGPPCHPYAASWSLPVPKPGGLEGEVILVDHFGNVITNITEGDLEAAGLMPPGEIQVGHRKIHSFHKTYGEGAPGGLMGLFGSSGHLEIAVNQGHAAELLQIGPGEPVLARCVFDSSG